MKIREIYTYKRNANPMYNLRTQLEIAKHTTVVITHVGTYSTVKSTLKDLVGVFAAGALGGVTLPPVNA